MFWSSRISRWALLLVLLAIPSISANAQFDKIKKKVPGLGSSSEVDTLIREIDAARVKSAYARVSLSLSDDIIRRQALRNTTRRSAEGQIEKDKQELAALDQSIAAKKKLLAELGRESNSGKYDEKTAADVDRQTKAEEEQRAQKRAQVDAEISDQEKRDKEMNSTDRENYGKLARLLYGAAKQERESVESAQTLKPRAETAATNSKNNPLSLASTQPKKLSDGIEGLGQILSEGPQHAATIASVANHLAKIGGVDLSDPKFAPKVVTDEDEVPEWK
jgi:hypothetical protein